MQDTVVTMKDTTSNPAPLGLLGFGMTTVLLNLHNAGFFPLDTMILAMGIFYGGIAQIIAGVMEWKKNNIFGTTAFISYGLFWLTLVGLIAMGSMGFQKPSPVSMCAYLGMWGLFTAAMFIATLKFTRTLRFIFASLAILFFLLAIGQVAGSGFIKVAGYCGIVCGLSAIYGAMAQVLNEIDVEEKAATFSEKLRSARARQNAGSWGTCTSLRNRFHAFHWSESVLRCGAGWSMCAYDKTEPTSRTAAALSTIW